MSIDAHIFLSSKVDPARYEYLDCGSDGKNPQEHVEYRRLTNLELGTLWAIIEGKEFDFDRHDLESMSPQTENWLFRFPDEYVNTLAQVTPDRLNEIAKAWADTEELEWNASEAKEGLEDFIRLAKLSKARSKPMYLWGSV